MVAINLMLKELKTTAILSIAVEKTNSKEIERVIARSLPRAEYFDFGSDPVKINA